MTNNPTRSFLAIAIIHLTVAPLKYSLAEFLRGVNNGKHHYQNNRFNRILLQDEIGTFLVSDEHNDDGSEEEIDLHQSHRKIFNVELRDGTIYRLKNTKKSWETDKAKTLKSGEEKIKIKKGAFISGGEIDLRGDFPDDIEDEQNNFTRSSIPLGRHLNDEGIRTIGERTVLAVLVKTRDSETTFDEATLSDKVFGSSIDPVNLASQYEKCSYNQLNFVKAVDRSGNTTSISNGVVSIFVDYSTTDGGSTVRNAVTTEIKSEFGKSPFDLADHVMYCMPPNTISKPAYGYLNSWLTVYNDVWCNRVSAQIHEIGHNIGFTHSNQGAVAFGDKTCMMGASYKQFGGPEMCFNGAKSFQSTWYKEGTLTLTPKLHENSCFSGRLYGLVDFNYFDSPRDVLIKIEQVTSATAYFVLFNREHSFNSGTVIGGDNITITSSTIDDSKSPPHFGASNLLAMPGSGDSYSISNFDSTGKNLIIAVKSVNIGELPGYSDIEIQLEGSNCNTPLTSTPTTSPTNSPTTQPTSSPTVTFSPPNPSIMLCEKSIPPPSTCNPYPSLGSSSCDGKNHGNKCGKKAICYDLAIICSGDCKGEGDSCESDSQCCSADCSRGKCKV